MRIEILVDSEDPQIFPLNKPKMIIGSHESCDIILNSDGISRKHLIISSEDDNYFAIDQGSTNGSYVNEERLVPGRRVEFTSFFPVRLGSNVLVSLLSDEDASDLGFMEPLEKKDSTAPKVLNSGPSESTRAISLKDLQSGTTKKLQTKRNASVAKRKSAISPSAPVVLKEKNRMLLVKVFCVALVGAAAYYNFHTAKPDEAASQVKNDKINDAPATIPEIVPRFPVVDALDLTSKTRFDGISKGLSCTSDLEIYLCNKFSSILYSVIQSGTMVHLFLNGDEYYKKAKELIPRKKVTGKEAESPEDLQKYQDDLKFVTIILFLTGAVPRDLEYDRLKNVNLTFAIKISLENGTTEYLPAVFVPETLAFFLRDFKPGGLKLAKRHGAGVFLYLKNYFKTY